MKIVMNRCYGGYGLSVKARKEVADLKGKELYFFELGMDSEYIPLSFESAQQKPFVFEYTVPNPKDYRINEIGEDGTYADENERAGITIDFEDRTDPDIISVVERLGTDANGRHARLEVVEIPDDVDWEISKYDGFETIEEKHRSL